MERLVRSLGPDNDGIVGDGLKVTFGGFAIVELKADLLTGAQLFEVVPFGILGATKRGTNKEDTKEWEHYSDAIFAHSESPRFNSRADYTCDIGKQSDAIEMAHFRELPLTLGTTGGDESRLAH